MTRSYSYVSSLFIIFTILIFLYHIFSLANHTWLIAPTTPLLIILLLLSLITGVFSLLSLANNSQKFLSTINILLSILIFTMIVLALCFVVLFSPSKVFQESATSPNGEVNIDFYVLKVGATGSDRMIIEQNGPLWFSKQIYNGPSRGKEIDYTWESDRTIVFQGEKVSIN